MFNKLYLWCINQLLYPYVLGLWSDNDLESLCVTNRECTQYRWLGGEKWSDWNNNPGSPRIYNEYLEVLTPRAVDRETFTAFLKQEGIKNPLRALSLARLSRPYFLCRVGDLQAQYHYGLTISDPMTITKKQKVSFIFPGTVLDMYDSLPEEEITLASPLLGGSLGWLAHLDSKETIAGITAAKKRLS